MKKGLIVVLTLTCVFMVAYCAWCACATIQDGTILTSDGRTITPGYDEWGYNYEAHMFNGTYCDAYRNAAWCQPYVNDELIMKWNDEWLSNKDCDGDGLLDRHYGYPSYIGSGAWLTNHQSGLVDVNGKMKKWTYFVKIVAAPKDAVKAGGIWYTDATQSVIIGPDIWEQFAIVQEIYNDPSAGLHGKLYKSPAGPGFGIYGKEGD